MEEEYPRIVTPDELRFSIWFALSQIPPSLWRAWILGKELRSDSARDMIVDKIAERLAKYQFRAPAPLPAHCLNPISRKEFHNPPWKPKEGD